VKELTLFNVLLICWFVLAVAVFVALFFVVAPYGRHLRSGWGHTIGNRMGWIIMEAPAPLAFAVCFMLGNNPNTATALVVVWPSECRWWS